MSRQKLIIFMLLSAALVLLFVLASGVVGLQLSPGGPITMGKPPSELLGPGQPQAGDFPTWLVRGVSALLFVLVPVALIYMLFTAQGRRRLLGMILNIILLMLILQFIQQNAQQSETTPMPTQDKLAAQTAVALRPTEITPDYVSNPPEWMSWLISLVVAVVVTAMAVGVYWLFRPQSPEKMLIRLAEEAQLALDQIQAGGDVRATILACYKQMMRAIQNTRGIQREPSLTPREFEHLLETQGLPADPVRRLTRLFEEARYNVEPMRPQQEQLAILCLQDIVAACEAARETAVRQAALDAAQQANPPHKPGTKV